MVKQRRVVQPRDGTRKLRKAIKLSIKQLNIEIGRDSLFDILERKIKINKA